MRHGSLFSGIGGFDLAASWMGWENMFHCEWNQFGQKVLKYYWPNAISYDDICKTDFTIWRGKIDILTTGFPCQPFSTAGEQRGAEDERYLWEESIRAIRECKAAYVVAENVRGITSRKFEDVFEQICTSLEAEGYEVQPIIIPASSVGAEHERYRVWIIAYSKRLRLSGQGKPFRQMHPAKIGDRQTSRFVEFIQRTSMPFVCNSHYGIPGYMADEAVRAAGNAIVPQVALQIFKVIEQMNRHDPDRSECG